MKMKSRRIPAIAIAFFLTAIAAGCTPKAAPEDAIQKALMDYLATRPGLDISKMDVSIAKVAINNDRAEADVKFQVKGGGPAASMEIHYTLMKDGPRQDGAWKVQSSPGGHPGSGAEPVGGAAGAGGAGADRAGSGPGFHPDTTKPDTKQ